jgi:hypothetical protein
MIYLSDMEKKKFVLDDADFNRIAEISANPKPIIQIIDGQVVWATKQLRADEFWCSISVKYGFNPMTVETNLPMMNGRHFIAEAVEFGEEKLVNWCKLCNQFSGPDTDSGCARYKERGCSWYISNKPDSNK